MSESPLQYPREALHEWLRERNPEEPLKNEQLRLLGNLIDTLFFASLAREEGRPALAHIVYHADGVHGLERTREHADFDTSTGPALAWSVIPLSPIPFTVKALAKLTPAAQVERTAIIVGPHEEQLHILGLARRSRPTDGGSVYVFSAPEPGFIVLQYAGEELFRYERGQRLSPEQKFSLWKVLTTDGLVRRTISTLCPNLIKDLYEASFFKWPDAGISPVSLLLHDLINTMVSIRHGGLIAIHSAEHTEKPFYSLSNYQVRFGELLLQFKRAETQATRLGLMRPLDDHSNSKEERDAAEEARTVKNDLASLVENIGRLTALDNALLLGPELKVIGAGFAISTLEATAPRVRIAQDLSGTPGAVYDINQHGSRHRAAAWFAFKNPGGLVFLVSHDGPLRCLTRPVGSEDILLWNLRLFGL